VWAPECINQDFDGRETLHERGKKEWIQKEDLKWLLSTRTEYIRCYYLHLAVDNILENKDRIKYCKETLDNCIDGWGKNRAVVVPGTEPYLRDVLGFLRNNAEKIRQIIFQDIVQEKTITEIR